MNRPQPSKKQRDIMAKHASDPQGFTQAEVMRQLGLIDSNAFYRLFYRCIILKHK